ncbi:MAG: glycosyltransferase family 4 protein [Anaerolineae bacterium]|nr:glycosyltransferase family 4 protein [Anaerolineae bacterium]
MSHKTYIVYPYFAHYRLPILKKIQADLEIQPTFISGVETDERLKIIDAETARQNGLNWRLVKNHWLFGKRFLWQSDLIKVCLYEDYDFIVFLASPFFITTWIAMIIAKLRKRTVIQWGHFILRHDLKRALKRVFYGMPDGLWLYGSWAKGVLIKLGFKEDRLVVINNSLDHEAQLTVRAGLDLQSCRRERAKYFRHPERPMLLFLGRLTRRKRIDLLIEAAAKLRDDGFMVNVLIIGDGETGAMLKHLVSEKMMDEQVVFMNETYSENEIAMLFGMADLTVSPGDVGLLAMHSMVYGTPVISHDNPYRQMPEFEAIIPGKTGQLYEYDSVDSMAGTIRAWLETQQGRRDEIRQDCQAVIDQYYTPEYQLKMIKHSLRALAR